MKDRKFEDVLHSIEDAEKDVDKVLDAARLSRTESDRRLSADQKMELLEYLMILVGVLGFFSIIVVMIIIRFGG